MRIKVVSKINLQDAYQKWGRYKKLTKIKDQTTEYLVSNSCNIMDSIIICKSDKNENVFALFDNDNKIQGAFSYRQSPDYIRVSYFASAPWNVIGLKKRNKGCGRQMMRFIFKRTLKNVKIKYIELIAHTEAEGFYEKLGFKEEGTCMKINRQKIRKILNG